MRGPDGTGAPTAVIGGLGSWLPPNVVGNADLAARLDTTEDWIAGRTGILERRICDPDTLTSDIATTAGARALRSADEDGAEAVVLATTTPDRTCPASAPLVAARLGLSGAAFDIAAVCTGFLYGLAVAAGLVVSGTADRVLLIAADRFSTLTDPQDRTTVPIFGDGAGAVLLRRGRAGDPGALGPVILGSDGAQRDLITVRPSGVASPEPGGARAGYFEMQGRKVFRHAVERMGEAAADALAAAGWDVADVDRLVAHQANARITANVADRLGLPAERRVENIARVGNTAAASIPILLAQAADEGRLRTGHRVLMTAFGGGLTWGATTVLWPDVKPRTDD
ncbi:beta-ketoacyl-ACP synthase III [Embleya hyalina]|uniref:Beta-ketoacyl-[acyl-carrier-protein] synthase III n=1 Tax=Embleya hyalina TaxID=516124 RepID=A0A401Z1Z7_9ACTN|nr:beta-ketoacyl-ACP synthase III [Embleya hyalina]GCE00801.1 3-oxoacyl-[acyl-carrier-protein] synthase 3 protein 3 [Embleya hyalina]